MWFQELFSSTETQGKKNSSTILQIDPLFVVIYIPN